MEDWRAYGVDVESGRTEVNRKRPADMNRGDPAGIHFFSFWSERAKDETAPLWLRLAALAYSHHRKNGHASFALGSESTLPEVLGKSRVQIQNEIRRAVQRGYLDEQSNINCLVLPYEICGGAEGHPMGLCDKHSAKP